MAEKWHGLYTEHKDTGNGFYQLKITANIVLK